MENRDKLVLLLMLGGIGYGVFKKWDVIVTRLGLDDLHPGRIKAMELCKEAFTFEQFRPNGLVMEERVRGEAITPVGDLWSADQKGDDLYLVHCCFKEGGDIYTQDFDVDIASGKVTVREMMARPAR